MRSNITPEIRLDNPRVVIYITLMDKTLIRTARHAAGLTQVAVASAVGTSERNYKWIEHYDTAPSVWLALRIARELGVRVDDLWPLEDHNA